MKSVLMLFHCEAEESLNEPGAVKLMLASLNAG
jgi:hypothetical protein